MPQKMASPVSPQMTGQTTESHLPPVVQLGSYRNPLTEKLSQQNVMATPWDKLNEPPHLYLHVML